MALSTPVGTSYYISQTFAATKTVTGISAANPGLATSVAHGYADDDEILLQCSWDLAKNSVYQVDQQSADTFLVMGLNTTNTNNFASGGGAGTASKISSWLELPNVLSISPQGGTARFVDVRLLKSLQGLKLPDGFEAMSITFDIGFDPSETNWATLLDISRNTTPVAYKSVKGSGAATYGYGYFMMGEAPMQSSGQVDRVQGVFAALGRTISYA